MNYERFDLTPEQISELKKHFEELTPEEQKEAEEILDAVHIDDALDIINELLGIEGTEEAIPSVSFSEPDYYFQLEKHSDDDPHSNVYFDYEGHLHARNLSAWWIPELTIEREIGGTVYTVTGSFEGEEIILRKLERISAKKFTNTEVNANDIDAKE